MSTTGPRGVNRARRISVSALVDVHELTGFTLVQVSTRGDTGAAARWLSEQAGVHVAPGLGNLATGTDGGQVLGIGPGRWLVHTAAPWPRDGVTAGLALTNMSDAWRLFQLSGIAARRLLAGGCPLDLDARRFAPGSCAATRYDEFHVLLCCTAPDTYDLYVERSYADDLRARIVVRAAGLATPAELDG